MKDTVYYNFSFLDAPEAAAVQAAEAAAQEVMEVGKLNRADGASLADLHNPLKMPKEFLNLLRQTNTVADAYNGI